MNKGVYSKPVCDIEMGILDGDRCNRPAVKELRRRGQHVLWLCKLHAEDYVDENGESHCSVHWGRNMIPHLKQAD